MKLIYRPANGAGFSKEKAQQIGEVLETLGVFQPIDVVNSARPETSPLHDQFEWNDTAAAEKWRLQEARQLVNHIVVIVKQGGKELETKAFHSIRLQDSDERVESRYASIKVVAKNDAMKAQIVANALRELEGWRDRHEQYSDLIGPSLFVEIKKTVRRSKTQAQVVVGAA